MTGTPMNGCDHSAWGREDEGAGLVVVGSGHCGASGPPWGRLSGDPLMGDGYRGVRAFKYLYHYSDSVMLEVINPHVTKILLALEEGDSISRIVQKTGGSYGWTHKWIQTLEEIGVIARDDGIAIADEAVQDAYTEAAQTVLARTIDREDAYLLPNFSGMDYRYAQTDAVFMWTKGGYQIGRSQDDYPIFIDVREADVEKWEQFFDDFGQDYRIGDRTDDADGIYYVLFPQDAFDVEWVEHAAVPPLEETVAWAQEYEVNFQPALELLDEMYDIGVDVTYRERETL